jgi:mono/diheme cytochrome c family protein
LPARLHPWLATIVAAAVLGAVRGAAADDASVGRGEYLIHAGGCITCHTKDEKDAVPLAGGRALETPFGTFYSPNITPHEETGIGRWTDDEFVTAFWNGVGPDGEHYFPAFPYTSYTGILREDLLAMKAYLFSLEPVDAPQIEHDLSLLVSSRSAAGMWKSRYFKPGRFEPDATQSEEWNRGAYLVRHLGHCGECHTPRTRFGDLLEDRALSGNPEGPDDEKVPGIRDTEDGIGDWSVDDIEYFLDIGMLPDGDFAGGSMAPVIDDNTSHLTGTDRRAIATYLKSLN